MAAVLDTTSAINIYWSLGTGYGADLIAYTKDPLISHAQAILHVVSNKIDPNFLASTVRVAAGAKKKVVIAKCHNCNDDSPRVEYLTLSWCGW
jgi:tRNA splicing endonuclease